LAKIEEEVKSPHLQQADSSVNVDAARNEVAAALNSDTDNPDGPVAALNAQPLGPELHQDSPSPANPNIHESAPNASSPADTPLDMPMPPGSASTPKSNEPASSPGAPPLVPPPMIPPPFNGSN
jgi:hypothetical protein